MDDRGAIWPFSRPDFSILAAFSSPWPYKFGLADQ